MYIPVEMMVHGHGHVGDDNVIGQENILAYYDNTSTNTKIKGGGGKGTNNKGKG